MAFIIAGQICEKESKLPVAGLIVRAIDQGGRFEHVLSATATDSGGRFRLEYEESAVPELFEARPLVHVRLYAPPWRCLLDSPKSVRWSEHGEARLDVKVPRKLLGPLSPARPDGTVDLGIRLERDALKIEKRGQFDVPHLAGFRNTGPVAGPALPEKVQTVILPLDAENLKLDIKPGRAVRLPGPVSPLPVQPSRPEVPSRNGNDGQNTFVQLHPRYGRDAGVFPKEMAVMGAPVTHGFFQVVQVRVRPVQYDPIGASYIFYPHFSYAVRYELAAREAHKPRRFTEARLEQLQEFVDHSVAVLAKDIGAELSALTVAGMHWYLAPSLQDIDYLIITSNYAWPEIQTETSTSPFLVWFRPPHADEFLHELGDDGQGNGPGPVDQFRRLAKWKTQRGVRTAVVTVEQILSGAYGDFTEVDSVHARDLQEVIRNFLKKTYEDHPFSYLLLGGSRAVIPMRYLIGYVTLEGKYPAWDFSKNADAQFASAKPPPRCCAKYNYNPIQVRLCHDRILGAPTTETVLCTSHGGAIPFKTAPGDGKTGWYFADEDFEPVAGGEPAWYPYVQVESFTETPNGADICNIVVEGPNWVVDDGYYWAFRPDRFMPSDLYYACLAANETATAGPNSHDWDLNGNGLYGQFRWDGTSEVTIDSTAVTLPDVWVGRAPIESGADAKAFVDKVLTYECLATLDGAAVDPAYLKQVVLAGDVMRSTDHLAYQRPNWSDSSTPDPGTFTHQAGAPSLLVHLQPDLVTKFGGPEGARRHLLVRFNRPDALGLDVPVPVKQAGKPGWFFVKQQSGQYVASTIPTEFVKIEGEPFSVKPHLVIWRFGREGVSDDGAGDCEDLLANQLQPQFPDFDNVLKYYVEFLDFQPDARDLTPATIRTQLDRGCHFLVLRGHGSFNGLCMVWWYDEVAGARPDFRNHGRYFIAYAPSCNTAQPDFVRDDVRLRSLGEVMVLQPEGGAVAYVGYTRIGVGAGTRQQEIFWDNLRRFGRLGMAAGTPSSTTQDLDDMYQYYNQILYGDPNMAVWREVPNTYEVSYPDYVDLSQDSMQVTVLHGGVPVKNQRVTLLAGWHDDGRAPAYFQTKVTGDAGTAAFSLRDFPEDQEEATLTVTCWPKGTNFIPFQTTIPVYEVKDGWRRCTKCGCLFYRYGDPDNPAHLDDCAGGGRHETAASEEYKLIRNSPQAPGQQNWRRCTKCQGLFYAGSEYGNAVHHRSGYRARVHLWQMDLLWQVSRAVLCAKHWNYPTLPSQQQPRADVLCLRRSDGLTCSLECRSILTARA